MKYYDSKGQEVEILETDGGYDEAHVISAQYLDPNLTDEENEVPEKELDYLTDTYQEEVSQNEYEKMISAAEAIFEGDR